MKKDSLLAGWLCGCMTGLWSRGLGFKSHLSHTFFSLYWKYFFKWKLFFTLLWYSKTILYYSLFKFFMSSWKYLESKDIWGLLRVMKLHIGKRRPFLFITSFAHSLGPLICLKSPFFNFRSAKLPNLINMVIYQISRRETFEWNNGGFHLYLFPFNFPFIYISI